MGSNILPEAGRRPTARGPAVFTDRLRWARLTRQLSQEQLGAGVGETKQGIDRKEQRGLSCLAEVQRLADALGCSAAWLAFGVGPPFSFGFSKRSVDRSAETKPRRRGQHAQ